MKVKRLTNLLRKRDEYCPVTNWEIPELLEERRRQEEEWHRLMAGAQEALDWLDSHGHEKLYGSTSINGSDKKS